MIDIGQKIRGLFRATFLLGIVYLLAFAWYYVGAHYFMGRNQLWPGILYFGISVLIFSIWGIKTGSKSAARRHTWELFASKYKHVELAQTSRIAEGVGLIADVGYYLKISASVDGVVIDPLFFASVLLPWSDISRLDRGTLTFISGKQCDPTPVALLHLWRQFSGRAALPWDPTFDNFIPKSVALNEVGHVYMR